MFVGAQQQVLSIVARPVCCYTFSAVVSAQQLIWNVCKWLTDTEYTGYQ